MRDDQLRVGIAVDAPREIVCDRRQASSPVDENRHLALGRELEHRRQPLVVQQELLRARMQLDSARAAVEAPSRLADRIFGEVEPYEWHQLSAASLGVGERPVVSGPEARVAVGLVEAEDEAARDPVLRHPALEVVVDAHHPVDVRPEMHVRVEDVRAVRQLAAQLVVPLRHQLLGTLQRFVHSPESMQRCPAWVAH